MSSLTSKQKWSAFVGVFALALVGAILGVLIAWVTRPGVFGFTPSVEQVVRGLKGTPEDHEAAMEYVLRVLVGGLVGTLAGGLLGYAFYLAWRAVAARESS